MAFQFTSGRFRYETNAGLPAAGYRLYTYESGTTTQKNAFADSTLGTPCTYVSDGVGGLYIALDSRGEAQVWLGTGAYTFVVKNTSGSTVETTDGVIAPESSGSAAALEARLADTAESANGTSLLGWLRAATGAVAATLKKWLSWRDMNAFEFMTAAQIADVEANTALIDVSAALNSAFAAAANRTLHLGAGTFGITATTAYAIAAPATRLIVKGIPGKTIIKLLSASVDCHMIGRATACEYFHMEGVTLDGNKSTVSGRNIDGLYFAEASNVISRGNTFKDMNDMGSLVGGKGIYVSNTTLCDLMESTGDKWTGCEGYSIQTYKSALVFVRDGYATGILNTFADINGQTILSTDQTKTHLSNNVIVCDASFPTVNSVFSLMGNDVECVGNKVNGGGVQIVVHDGTTETIRNYLVSGNFLWEAKGSAIVVNQTSGSSASNSNVVVSDNMIYQPASDGIALVGTYAGSGATTGTCTVTGNTIIDNLTTTPAPEAYACIRALGMVNLTIDGNSIAGPRWAGIQLHYDGRNIVVSDNTITDHQGRTTTGSGGATPQAGGAIFIGGGSATAYLGNIAVTGNVISNYATQVSPQASFVRTGAIVVNEANAQDISIKNNRIKTGNTSGISLLSSVNITAESNEVTGFYGEALNTASGVGAGCLLTYAVSGRREGTTAQRPTLQSTQIGYNYWDTTIPSPIWWNGTVWKDAANTTV